MSNGPPQCTPLTAPKTNTATRETFKRVLNFPPETKIEWKVHEESIQQRITVEESRKERANQHKSGNKQNNQRQAQQHQQGNDDSAPAPQAS